MFPTKTWLAIKVSTLLFLVTWFALVFLAARITADDDHFNRPGNTLIADQFPSDATSITRLMVVLIADPGASVAQTYGACGKWTRARAVIAPWIAERIGVGEVLPEDVHRVIEVDRDVEIVRSFGEIATLGYNTKSVAHGGLNSPYDAKRIGDYTGLTPPFDNDHDADSF